MIEYLQVALITVGVCVFNFGGKKKKGGKADSPYGLALIGLSLLMDAFTGGLQDKVIGGAQQHLFTSPSPSPSRFTLIKPLRNNQLTGLSLASFRSFSQATDKGAIPYGTGAQAALHARVDALDEPLGFLVAFFLALVTVHRKGAAPLDDAPPITPES